MIMAIYKKAFEVLMKKPVRLWGISLLFVFLTYVGSLLCGIAIPIFGLAVSMLLSTSMTLIFLHGYRGEEVKAVNLFDAFRDWQTIKRVLAGMGWMLLWVFLWSLIPIVGIIFGIIRSYEYRLTPYILMLEPDVKPTEAIKVSKERTHGWKGKMFWADVLIYVFFYIAVLLLGLLSRIPYAGVLFAIIMGIFVILFCLLITLFTGLVQAAFYEEIQKWGTYPGRDAYAAPRQPRQPRQPKGPAPGAYPPPQGYDPQQGYPPQGYAPYGDYQQPGYPPQYAPQQPGYPPQYAPQPEYPQQPGAYPPPQYAPQQDYTHPPYQQPEYPKQPAAPEYPQVDVPQPNFPQAEPPVYPQPDFPEPPAAPDFPEPDFTQDPPQE